MAYVFWHRPRRTVGRLEYESTLRAFHRALATRPPAGLLGSCALRAAGAPWGSSSMVAYYEDVYYLDGFARLGPIVDVAYRFPWAKAHRSIARRASFGTAALYVSRGRPFPMAPPESSGWFDSLGSARLSEIRSLLSGTGASLWQRHLALGPAPEFVVRGPAKLAGDHRLRRLIGPARWLRYELVAPESPGRKGLVRSG